jgi:hypothetical protein
MMSNQAGLGLGDKVHTLEINEYPDDLKEEYLYLSTWVKALARHYGYNIVIRVIDPQSLVGMWAHLRHRIHKYPTLILNHQEKFVGWESEERFHRRILELLKSRGASLPKEPFSMLNMLTPSEWKR